MCLAGSQHTLTATSADGECGQRRVVTVVGLTGGLAGAAKGVAEEVDGVSLEVEPCVGVDGGGDADVRAAEKFLDHDEVNVLFQEQGGGGVWYVVEADAAQPCPVEEWAKAPGEVGGVERAAGGRGEDEPAVRPARSGGLAFFLLRSRWSLRGLMRCGVRRHGLWRVGR